MSESVIDAPVEQTEVQPQPELINGVEKSVLEKLVFPDAPPSPFSQPAQQQAPEATPAPAETTPAPEQITATPDYTAFVKEFGFEKVDDFKAEFETLKKLKETQPAQTREEIAFANEQSKKIHEALVAGETKKVRAYLEAQELLEGYETMNTEQKLKLQIKLQNPRFDDELVEDEYKALYGFNEEDFEGDALKLRKEKIRYQQKLENAEVGANEFLNQYKQKIELPTIEKQQAVDPDFEAYKEHKAGTAEMIEYVEKVIRPAITSVKESDVKMGFQLKDEKNQMDFNLSIDVVPESLEQARKAAFTWNEFFTSITSDEKGEYSAPKAIQAILKLQNFDKYVLAAARQAVNAERARLVNSETPNAVQKDYSIQAPTGREEIEKMIFSV